MAVSHVVMNGDSLSMNQMNQKVPVPADMKASVEARFKLFPELNFNKSGYTMQLAPTSQLVSGQLAYLVTVGQAITFKVKSSTVNTNIPNDTFK